MNISDYNNVEISKISYSNPDKYKGSYICTSKYDNEDLYIQTPMMTNLDGVHKTDTRAHIDLYFEKDHLSFYKFLGDMDDNNIQTIHNNSQQWFNKSIDMDILEDLYSTPLKHKNPPKFKLKVPLSRGKVDITIIDSENKPVEPSDIPNDCKLVVLMKYIGLKFLKEQVLSEWLPVQIKVCEKVESTKQSLIDETLLETNANDANDANDDHEEIDLEIQELPDDFNDFNHPNENEEPSNDIPLPEPNNDIPEHNNDIPEPSNDIPEPSNDIPIPEPSNDISIPEPSNDIFHQTQTEEHIKKTVEEEFNELKKKYSAKDSELNKLKEVLRNFISN